MKVILKVSCSLILLIIYFVLAIFLYPFLYIAPHKTRFLINYMIHYLCKGLLLILSVNVNLKGSKPKKVRGKLIVCNHVSYLDILITASQFPICFITSNEMKNTPGLGLICILAGCLFVERRNRENISSEVDEIRIALENGLNVMLFAEARTTSGEEVVPFKRSLFHAATTAKTDTLPLCLNYISLNDEPISMESKEKLFWYGNKSFAPHFVELCRQGRTTLELSILEVITNDSISSDSKLLRDKAFEVIQAEYKKIS